MKHHYWHAPTVPPSTIATATVTVRSDCGRRWSLPVWQFREMGTPTMPPLVDMCPTCLAEHIVTLAETDLDAAATLHDRALAVGALTPTEYTRISGRVHRARRMREAAGR